MNAATNAPMYPIPSRLNMGIAAVQLVAAASIFVLAAQASVWWHVAALAAVFALVGNSIYAMIHEAEHGLLHTNRWVNNAVGVVLALLFPAPFHLIRQGHIGHHLRNRSDDEAFDLYFPGESPAWKALQYYGILTGIFWLVIVIGNAVVLAFPRILERQHFEFDKPTAAFVESLNWQYLWRIRLEAAAVLMLHPTLMLVLGIHPVTYGLVYFGFGFSWSAMQYVHHYDTDRDVTRGARNLYLWAPIDWILLHHNWHLTHHKHPTVSWWYLPALGRREDPHREFLLRHYLRMWRGPRRATEHVENRYAGCVVR